MKNFRFTSIFALIVILFSTYVYYFEFVKKNEIVEQKEEAKRVLSWDANEIIGFEIIKGKKKIILHKKEPNKKDSQWQINSPIEDLASIAWVNGTIDTLLDEKTELIILGKEFDKSKFGLDNPLSVFNIIGAKRNVEISFGSVKSFDGNYYATIHRSSGDSNDVVSKQKVFLIKPKMFLLTEITVEELQDKQVFRDKSMIPNAIILKNDQNETIYKLEKNETWIINSSETTLDKFVLSNYIADIRGVKANKMLIANSIDNREKNFSNLRNEIMKNPDNILELSTGQEIRKSSDSKDKKNEIVYIKRKSKDKEIHYLVSASRKEIFEISKESKNLLVRSINDFKDRTAPFKFEKKLVREISWIKNGIIINLKKQNDLKNNQKNSGWSLKEDSIKNNLLVEVSSGNIISFFDALSKQKAMNFLTKKKGVGKLEHNFILMDENKKKVFEIAISNEIINKDGSKHRQIKTSQSFEVFTISEESYKLLGVEKLLVEKANLKNQKTTPQQTSKKEKSE